MSRCVLVVLAVAFVAAGASAQETRPASLAAPETALVHKNPNEMDGKPLTYTVDFDGNTLRVVIANPPFLPGRERRIVLSRIE